MLNRMRMLLRIYLTLTFFLLTSGERWSRQISNSEQKTEGSTGDWVPVTEPPIDRKGNERALHFSHNQNFFYPIPNGSSPKHIFPVGQPFQPFGFQTNQPQKSQQRNQGILLPQQPTSQSFFKFEMPFFGNEDLKGNPTPTVQADYQIHHAFPQQTLATSPLFNQQSAFKQEFHPNFQHQPQQQQFIQQRPIQQNFVEDTKQTKRYQNETPKTPPFNSQSHQPPLHLSNPPEQEEVQLLYVPYDTLYPQRHEQFGFENTRYNLIPAPVNPAQINNFYTPEPLTNPNPNLFSTSSSTSTTTTTTRPNSTYQPITNSQLTSSKPKSRPKPHQPPLAMFMQKAANKQSSVLDIIKTLGNAQSVAVLDAPSKSAPSIFIGPGGLPPPNGYTKFELPYLSSINRDNLEKRLQTIPFFVAPLSYRAPLGFNKILLPEPHVGSIVINKPFYQNHGNQFMPQIIPETTSSHYQKTKEIYLTSNIDNTKLYQIENTTPKSSSARPEKLIETTTPKQHYQFVGEYDAVSRPQQYISTTPQQHFQLNNEFKVANRPEQPISTTLAHSYELGNQQQLHAKPEEHITSTNKYKYEITSQFETRPEHSTFTSHNNQYQSPKEYEITNKPEKIVTSTIRHHQYPSEYEEIRRPQVYEYEGTRRPQHEIPKRHRRPTAVIHNYHMPSEYDIANRPDEYFREQSTQKIRPNVRTKGHRRRPYYEDRHVDPITSERTSSRIKSHKDNMYYEERPVQTSTSSTYGQFKPMPDNVISEEYFKVRPIATTTTSTTTTTEITSQLHQGTLYDPNPTVTLDDIKETTYKEQFDEYPSGGIYNKQSKKPSFHSGKGEEEYNMKTYFRQQDAFKSRPNVPITTPAAIYENIQYTPVSLNYDHHFFNIPSSTSSLYDESHSSTPQSRVTFYTPVPQYEEKQITTTSSPSENNQRVEYSHDEGQLIRPEQSIETTTKQSTTARGIKRRKRPGNKYVVPNNHRATYNNEITYNHDEKHEEQELEYDPNPYQLPSELPPITPNLPGLVNDLIEKDNQNEIEKGTTEMDAAIITTTTVRPTRRHVNRGRRPTVTKISSSVSYSSSDSSTKRPINRNRRPYYPRINNQTLSTTSRTPIVRNPNKIRYNPTAEERQRIRTRTRFNGSVSKKEHKQEEDNLEYQRDVLLQNYPVFKTSPKTITTSTTTTTTTEKPEEHQEVTAIPRSDQDLYPSLMEPVQIAEEYQHLSQTNYGPGYFPNAEDATPTETSADKSEIHLIYIPSTSTATTTTTTSTTTTEIPVEETKKPLFLRRPFRPIRTTTEHPTTTAQLSEERYTVRPRVRPEHSNKPKPVKIRGRIRKPHPASSTTTTAEPEPEQTSSQSEHEQLNQFNPDFYQQDYRDELAERFPSLPKFNLDIQESQWSPSLSRVDGFKPITSGKSSYNKNIKAFDNDQEIVTAGSNQDDEKNDNFSIKVSAGFESNSYDTTKNNTKSDEKNSTEVTFSDLVEDVMTKVEKEYGNKKNPQNERFGYRRGAYKRITASQQDSLEAAESQNIASQLYNSIFAQNHKYLTESNNKQKTMQQTEKLSFDSENTTATPTTDSSEVDDEFNSSTLDDNTEDHSEEINNASSVMDLEEYSTTATIKSLNYTTDANIHEAESSVTESSDYDENIHTSKYTITRRMDENEEEENDSEDLASQPSIYDEVRKQLSLLFSDDGHDEINPIKQRFRPIKQEYTNIQRIRGNTEDTEDTKDHTEIRLESITKSPFQKDLKGSAIYATSTSKEISHETEICYRGRCIKTAKQL